MREGAEKSPSEEEFADEEWDEARRGDAVTKSRRSDYAAAARAAAAEEEEEKEAEAATQQQMVEPEPEPEVAPVSSSGGGGKKPVDQRAHIALEFLTTETTYCAGLSSKFSSVICLSLARHGSVAERLRVVPALKVEWVDQLRFKCQQQAKSRSPSPNGASPDGSNTQKKKRSRRPSIMGGDKADTQIDSADGSNGFPDTEDVDKLFGNVESLLVLSEQLLGMLRDRIGDEHGSEWSPDQKLGDIFVTLGPYFKVFKEYVKGFDAASAHLNKMREEYVSPCALILGSIKRRSVSGRF